MCKNLVKNLSSKYEQKLLDATTNPLKTASKRPISKWWKQQVICLGMRSQKRLQRPLKRMQSIRKNLNLTQQQRCLRKCTSHQKSDSKLFMKLNYYNHKYVVRMEQQKIKNYLNKTNDQTPKFGTREQVEVSDFTINAKHNQNSKMKFNTLMSNSSLCHQ